MQSFKTVFFAEHIKIKKRGIYLTSILLSAFFPLLFFIYHLVDSPSTAPSLPFNLFERSYSELSPLINFFWPLLIIINASRLAQLDHKLGGWQWMEIQPVSKCSIYFAKFSVLVLSLLAGVAAFFTTAVLSAWLLPHFIDISPSASLHLNILPLLHFMLRIVISLLCFAALQYAISVLMPSFIGPILIGFFLLFSSFILSAFDLSPRWNFMEFLPLAGKHYAGGDLGKLLLYPEKLSLVIAAFILAVGFWWYREKTIRRAFFKDKKQTAISFGIVAAFSALFLFVYSPNRSGTFGKTVLTGSIDSPEKIEQIIIVHPYVKDTLAIIGVKDNHFRCEIKGDVPLDTYRMYFDKLFYKQLTFSTGDSLHIKSRYYNEQDDSKVTGTRLAENQAELSDASFKQISFFLQRDAMLNQPDKFFSILYNEYRKLLKKRKEFVTIDNYAPRQDFMDKGQKIIALQCLNYAYEYTHKRKAVHPNDKTEWPKNMASLKKEVKMDDQSLLSCDAYIKYLGFSLSENNAEASPFRELTAVAKLKEGAFKNRLLFAYLNSGITAATSNEERAKLYSKYAPFIAEGPLRQSIEQTYQSFLRIGKGNPAPMIEAADLENNPVSLADFKGKYVLIDVWATWCGPCRRESPIFEKQAAIYQAYNIKFIAVSIDADKQKWLIEAKQKSSNVLQLHAKDRERLARDYQIPGIPHFIFINPEGKIISANYSPPSGEAFETILRSELNLKEEETIRLSF